MGKASKLTFLTISFGNQPQNGCNSTKKILIE